MHFWCTFRRMLGFGLLSRVRAREQYVSKAQGAQEAFAQFARDAHK